MASAIERPISCCMRDVGGVRLGQAERGVEPVDRLHQVERGADHVEVRLGGDQAGVRHVGAGEGAEHAGLAAHRLVAVGPLVRRRAAQHELAVAAPEPQQHVLGAAGDQLDVADRPVAERRGRPSRPPPGRGRRWRDRSRDLARASILPAAARCREPGAGVVSSRMSRTFDDLGYYTLAGAAPDPYELIQEAARRRAARPRLGVHLGALQRQGGGDAVGRARRGVDDAADRHRRHQPQHPPPDRDGGVRDDDAPPDRRPVHARARPRHRADDGRARAATGHHRAARGLRRGDAPAVARRDDPRPRRAVPGRTRSCASTRRSTRTSRSASRRSGRTRCASPAAPSTRSCCTRSSRTRRSSAACARSRTRPSGRARPGHGQGVVVPRHDRRPPPRARAAEEDGRPHGDVPPGLRRPDGRRRTVGTRSRSPRFRADPFVAGFQGAIDQNGDDRGARARRHADPRRRGWPPPRSGRRQRCVEVVQRQFDLGADGVILHGAAPGRARADRRRLGGRPPVTADARLVGALRDGLAARSATRPGRRGCRRT